MSKGGIDLEKGLKERKVSIIVPLYKVEQYFRKCLDSIVNQTYQCTEILMTDDGSPDSSGILADELAIQDSRAITAHQPNKWLGGARNTGIKLASGEYLLFVDSDDYIREDACEKLLQVIEKQDVNMVLFDIQHVDAEYRATTTASPAIEANRIISGAEARNILFDTIISNHTLNNAVTKLYKTTLFRSNELYFDETIRYAEDYEFCLRLFPHIHSFVHYDELLYYYMFNDKSIMHAADSQIVDKFILLYRHREGFMKRYGWDTEENQKKSAILLLTMIAKCLPKYLGRKKALSAIQGIKELFHKQELYDSLSRVNMSEIPLGRIGIIALYGIRCKCAVIVYIASLVLRRSEGNYR